MQALKPNDVLARVVAWHNRHPLARRIHPSQVHSIGAVVLPFASAQEPAAPGTAAGAAPLGDAGAPGAFEQALAARQAERPAGIEPPVLDVELAPSSVGDAAAAQHGSGGGGTSATAAAYAEAEAEAVDRAASAGAQDAAAAAAEALPVQTGADALAALNDDPDPPLPGDTENDDAAPTGAQTDTNPDFAANNAPEGLPEAPQDSSDGGSRSAQDLAADAEATPTQSPRRQTPPTRPRPRLTQPMRLGPPTPAMPKRQRPWPSPGWPMPAGCRTPSW